MNVKKSVMLLIFTLMSSSAFAGFLKEGNYLGKHNSRDLVNFLIKPVPERGGSFFAVLMKEEKKISLYIVDELPDHNSYSMTPLEVTKDGEIGIVNDDPSLVVAMAKNNKGQDVFKIMSANSTNTMGFDGYFEFEGKVSKFSWLNFDQGQFESESNKSALQISDFNENQREATSVFTTKEINGTFVLREKFPSMYLINQNSFTASGEKRNKLPKAIAIFIEKKSWPSTNRKMLLINPKNDTDIKEFTKK